jgi:hypothetical protein
MDFYDSLKTTFIVTIVYFTGCIIAFSLTASFIRLKDRYYQYTYSNDSDDQESICDRISEEDDDDADEDAEDDEEAEEDADDADQATETNKGADAEADEDAETNKGAEEDAEDADANADQATETNKGADAEADEDADEDADDDEMIIVEPALSKQIIEDLIRNVTIYLNNLNKQEIKNIPDSTRASLALTLKNRLYHLIDSKKEKANIDDIYYPLPTASAEESKLWNELLYTILVQEI